MNPKLKEEDVQVGFTFHKFFEGYGWFKGKVVQIREGAQNKKTRRVLYVDGDGEDMSLHEINMAQAAYQKFIDDTMASAQQISPNRNSSSKHSREKSINRVKKIAVKRKKSYDMNIFAREQSREYMMDGTKNSTIHEQQDKEVQRRKRHKDNHERLRTEELTMMAKTNSNSQTSSFPEKKTAEKSIKINHINNTAMQSEIISEDTKGLPKSKKLSSPSNNSEIYRSSNESKMVPLQKISNQDDVQFKVGFEFHKFFPNLGWIKGKVMALYGDIRCIEYGRNNQEFLHIAALTKWIQLHEDHLAKSNIEDNDISPQFDEVENYVPLDLAAESTIPSFEKNDDDTDASEQSSSWLAVVASRISRQASKTNSVSDHSSDIVGKTEDTRRSNATADIRLSMDDVFYWFCVPCKIRSGFLSETCFSCRKKRHEIESISSALLFNAERLFFEGAFGNEGQDGMKTIPLFLRRCFPDDVIKTLLNHFQGKSFRVTDHFYELDSLYYWECEECSLINSFRRWFCPTCKRKKNDDCRSSPLLKIAFDVARDEKHVEDAIKNIPSEHTSAIPSTVMKSLVTCCALTSRQKERCRRPKTAGSDYCFNHQSSFTCIDINTTKSQVSTPCKEEDEHISPFISIEELISNVQNSLRCLLLPQTNPRRWQYKCLEDIFISERNEPFPLGLNVRRFFAGYGWHDGFITNVRRRDITDENNKNTRPVLLYRIQYNDGDQEDLLHHEVNSLRQLYDIKSVRSTAPPHDQIKIGSNFETVFGNIKIVNFEVNIDKPSDKGTVHVDIESQNGKTRRIDVELLKLERSVLRCLTLHQVPTKKVTHWLLEEDGDHSTSNTLPFIEWPPPKNKNNSDDQPILLSQPGLYMHNSGQYYEQDLDESDDVNPNDDAIACHRSLQSIPDSQRSGFDPSGILNYVSYSPFESIKCQVCKYGGDEHYLLICDECDRSYHTYCLRPVVVNIPRNLWLCPKCNPGDSTLTSYGDILEKYKQNPGDALSFMKIKYDSIEEYCSRHKEAFEILNCRAKWNTIFEKRNDSSGRSKSAVPKVGDMYISRNKDSNTFKLPEPLQDPELLIRSLVSIAAAAKYCGMEDYTETLVYEGSTNEAMNDSSLEKIEGLSKVNIEIFIKYKENVFNGVYPPIEVVYDENIGFLVKALAKIPKQTIVTEYIGAVHTLTECESSSSDSLMTLLHTGDERTSLAIDPSRFGNLARFFSGVNNQHRLRTKNTNMRTRRVVVDGKCRIVFFTCKDVMEGEILHYDYNAGVEGKSVDELVRIGFYDTSYFL